MLKTHRTIQAEKKTISGINRVFGQFVWIVMLSVFLVTPQASAKAKNNKSDKAPVRVELFVMSQCPFCTTVVKSLAAVSEKLGADLINIDIQFLGDEYPSGALVSMHGDDEVFGDLLFVCAKAFAPQKVLRLMSCMMENHNNIPANFKECGEKANVDASIILDCANSAEGRNLLATSFKTSKIREVKGSPTLFINGEKFVGGRSELQYMRAFCNIIDKPKPKPCLSLPPVLKLPATVISDRRCTRCNHDRILNQLKNMFPGLESEILDYSDPKGKKLYDDVRAMGFSELPLFLLDPSVKNDPEFPAISRFTKATGPWVILAVGSTFDPTMEICSNGIDDNGDSKIDCSDPECTGSIECRPEIPGKLDLFVMSHCPFAAKALNQIPAVLENFENDHIDFQINFVADVLDDGSIKSLHGQKEVDEDIRMICAQKHLAERRDFLNYVICRINDPKSDDWKPCLPGGMRPETIEECASSGAGLRLLTENINLFGPLKIKSSPSWIANNRHQFTAKEADQIISSFCEYNQELKGCGKAPESAAASESKFDMELLSSFMGTYYIEPRPEMIADAIVFIGKQGLCREADQKSPLLGFFSAVFSRHRDWMPEWDRTIASMDDSTKELMGLAKQLAGAPLKMIEFGSASPSMNDLLWGAFLASGDFRYIDAIVEVLKYMEERADLNLFLSGASAKWSLSSQAHSDKNVASALQKILKQTTPPVTKHLSEALRLSPESINKEINSILIQQKEAGVW